MQPYLAGHEQLGDGFGLHEGLPVDRVVRDHTLCGRDQELLQLAEEPLPDPQGSLVPDLPVKQDVTEDRDDNHLLQT